MSTPRGLARTCSRASASWIVAVAVSLTLASIAPDARAQADQPVTQSETRELSLAVGENRTLSALDVKSYSEGVESLVELRLTPDGKSFVVVAKRPGTTTILMIFGSGKQVLYTVNIFSRPMEIVEDELDQLLRGYPGIRMRRIGPRVFIEGGVTTEAEVQRILQIAKLYPGQVESLVVLGGAAADRKQNIRIDVYFIQLDLTKGLQIGVTWPARFGGGQLSASYNFLSPGAGFTDATAQVVDQALPALDLAASRGWAKVLKHSTVITANGSPASFSSGGEQNYRVVGGLAAEVRALQFGTKIDVLPRFDAGTNELEVKVQAAIADLTAPGSAGTDLPGRTTTDLSTLVSLRLGQAIILSGIQVKSQRRAVSGLPWLSEIPLLGVLFGRHLDQADAGEGAIFLIPSVVEAMSTSHERLVEDLLGEYADYSGNLGFKQRRRWQRAD